MIDRMKELEELAKPLVEWLQNNYTLHHQIVIGCDSVIMIQDTMKIPFNYDK